MTTEKLYTVIVGYNALKWIDACLTSLLKSSVPTEIILVDNCSPDGTADYVRENYDRVHVIRAVRNLGFGQGNNLGIGYALQKGADYIFLLNQDAWVEGDTLKILIEHYQSTPEYGLLSPVHLNGSGDKLDNWFKSYIKNELSEDSILYRATAYRQLPYIVSVNFVNAAAWLLPKRTIRKVGGFDPLFQHWGEDNNYINRMRYHGLEPAICLGSRICHDREQALTDRRTFLDGRDYREYLNHVLDPGKDVRLPDVKADLVKKTLLYIARLKLKPARNFMRILSRVNIMEGELEKRKDLYDQDYCFIDSGNGAL